MTLLQSDYYQHLLLAEFSDYADRLHGFKGELITHDTMLAREPRARDADIVLFYQKRIDLDQYFEQKLAADSPFSKLMEQEVNVGEKILSTAEGGRQILNILETYISYCKGEKEIKIITKYLNSIRATQENDGRSASHKAVAIGAASFAVTHSLASGAGASVAGTVLLAIWPILVLAALTIFFAWLTASTAYSPQVLFYANYLFNLDGLKDLKLNYAVLTCEALMAEIESNKNEIISKTFAHFRDFDAAIREFESLYPMLVINANSEDQQKGVLVYDGRRGADKQFENRVRYLDFEGQFLQFSANMAVEYGLLSVRPDSRTGNGVGVFFTGYEKVEFYENSFQFLIGYDLRSVPEERFYDEAWFFIRLVLNEGQGQYWPNNGSNQQARYYVVKARLKESGEVKADLNDLYKTSVGKEYIDLSTDLLNRGNTLEAFEDYQKRKTLTIWSVDEFLAETGLQPGRISTIKRSNDKVNPETKRFITNFLKSK